jgi:hypothetical protein
MLTTTKQAIAAILQADQSVDPAARGRMLEALQEAERGKTGEVAPLPPARLVRRGEAAKRLSVTPRAVDLWARSGLLNKVRLPGRTRACGFREADVDALIRERCQCRSVQ